MENEVDSLGKLEELFLALRRRDENFESSLIKTDDVTCRSVCDERRVTSRLAKVYLTTAGKITELFSVIGNRGISFKEIYRYSQFIEGLV